MNPPYPTIVRAMFRYKLAPLKWVRFEFEPRYLEGKFISSKTVGIARTSYGILILFSIVFVEINFSSRAVSPKLTLRLYLLLQDIAG